MNDFVSGQIVSANLLSILGNAIEEEDIDMIKEAWTNLKKDIENRINPNIPNSGNIQDEINTILAIQKILLYS